MPPKDRKTKKSTGASFCIYHKDGSHGRKEFVRILAKEVQSLLATSTTPSPPKDSSPAATATQEPSKRRSATPITTASAPKKSHSSVGSAQQSSPPPPPVEDPVEALQRRLADVEASLAHIQPLITSEIQHNHDERRLEFFNMKKECSRMEGMVVELNRKITALQLSLAVKKRAIWSYERLLKKKPNGKKSMKDLEKEMMDGLQSSFMAYYGRKGWDDADGRARYEVREVEQEGNTVLAVVASRDLKKGDEVGLITRLGGWVSEDALRTVSDSVKADERTEFAGDFGVIAPINPNSLLAKLPESPNGNLVTGIGVNWNQY